MRRKLFNLVAALSATLCLFALLQAFDASIHRDRYDRLLPEVALPGKLQLCFRDSFVLRKQGALNNEEWVSGRSKGIAQFNYERFHFRFEIDYWNYSTTTSYPPPEERGPIAGWAIGAPFWFVILIGAPIPCTWLVRRAREHKRLRRRKRGACE